MNGIEHYNYLPLWAKVAIERLDADSTLRTQEILSNLCKSYAWQYREVPTQYWTSILHICQRRFADFQSAQQ